MDIKEYIKKQLNEAQFEAAVQTESSSLILAGAGSGKTRTLTYKISYLIYWQRVNASNILAVTFTNKASNEMKERIKSIWEDIEKLGNTQVDDFDAMIGGAVNRYPTKVNLRRVGTFHSVFLRVLKEDIEKLEMKYNKSFGVYDESESISVIKDIIKTMKLADKINEKEIKYKISNLKNKWITYQKFLTVLDKSEELIWLVYEKYQKRLESSNSLDFDDLLFLPYLLFQKSPETLEKRKSKFRYILVDEAQDTNQIQFDLMKLLSGKDGNITFIGDDFQSIYMRRWAVMDNFLNISKRRESVKIFKLEINYRSKPHIVNAGNYIIARNTKQYAKNIVSHRTWNDQIRVFGFSDESDEALTVVDLIKKMKEEKNLKRSDFAILYRTNAQSQPFEQSLLANSIPYKVYGGFKFFDRKEIKDILSYVKYIINPQDSVALKRIINTPSRKIGTTTISGMEEYAILHNITLNDVVTSIDTLPINIWPSTRNNIKEFNTIIKFVKSQIGTMTVWQVIQSIVSNIKYKDFLIKTESKQETEDRMENIWQLVSMAGNYEWEGLEVLAQFIEEISLFTDIEESADGSSEFVKLMTVHSSKGLEFPIVFVVGLEENIFPLSKAKMDPAELEEERRLMYVAITRAKDLLFLSYANSRQRRGQTQYNAPSRFIEELPSELVKTFDISGAPKKVKSNITEWSIIKHKLFGKGTVEEAYADSAFVRFWNPKFGIRKVDIRSIELDG